MTQEIEAVTRNCDLCNKYKSSQQPEKPVKPMYAKAPMELIGADLCELNGKHYLVVSDEYSGFILCSRIPKEDTRTVTRILRNWFLLLGWPHKIRSDGGPCFRADFAEFCKRHRILHQLASAYNPESNGLAEAAVKNVKMLLKKCEDGNDAFEIALSEFRQTPRPDGYSPAELFFGRRLKGILPTIDTPMIDQKQAQKARQQSKLENVRNLQKRRATRYYQIFYEGDAVQIQDPRSGTWMPNYTVVKMRDDGHSYIVANSQGKHFVRNRRHIRKQRSHRSSRMTQETVTASATPINQTTADSKGKPASN
jgi:transposase InsO family protein